MNNSNLPLENVADKLVTDKTRRKRLKVISACCECRRKKTKCNGEKPCIGCIKTNLECRYANNNPQQQQQPQPQPQQQPQQQQQQQPQQQQHIIKTKPTLDINKATLHSIEHRLGAIEEILQLLLQQPNSEPRFGIQDGKRKHEEMDDYIRLPPPLNYPESSSSSVSSTSPKLNTIQNLLNEDKNQRRSAFYRLTAGSDLRPTTFYY
ncbi:hypothetical protein G6F56_013351 [Rhizopus delemar]|nr:hypothetical protein G6F56_013351 [Rhizopus delemar]